MARNSTCYSTVLIIRGIARTGEVMEQWVRRNVWALIPWAIIAGELSIQAGRHIYRLRSGTPRDDDCSPSPVDDLLPRLSKAEDAEQAYPSDAYPGSRDVTSPYGSLRVYEWGPEDGRKVLMVHGITNPSPALGIHSCGSRYRAAC